MPLLQYDRAECADFLDVPIISERRTLSDRDASGTLVLQPLLLTLDRVCRPMGLLYTCNYSDPLLICIIDFL